MTFLLSVWTHRRVLPRYFSFERSIRRIRAACYLQQLSADCLSLHGSARFFFSPEKKRTARLAVYPPPAVEHLFTDKLSRVKLASFVGRNRSRGFLLTPGSGSSPRRRLRSQGRWFYWKTSVLPPRECGTSKPRPRRWWTARSSAVARCTSPRRKWRTWRVFLSLKHLFQV